MFFKALQDGMKKEKKWNLGSTNDDSGGVLRISFDGIWKPAMQFGVGFYLKIFIFHNSFKCVAPVKKGISNTFR